ncbi:MAG: flagellar basal body P-ring formation chaperone FlgA [Rhodocyclaceae bacterium]
MFRRPFIAIAAVCCAQAALAQGPVDVARQTIEQFLIRQTQDIEGRVSVDVGRIVDSPTVQSCTAWEAFLPQGARIWKTVTVGLRCTRGGTASLFVPTKVRIDGPYVVMSRPVSGGQVIGPDDLSVVQGEVTAQPQDVITRPEQAVGQTARQALSDKQALRASALKSEAAVQAGQTVKVVTQGDGFSVVNEGRALNTAAIGQIARVRLDSGRVLNGVAREGGIVGIAMD